MKGKYIIKGLVAAFLVVALAASCDSYNEPLLDGIGNTQAFSPVGLTAKVKSQTTVELNWTAKEDVDHYVVEFSANDPEFKTIFKTVQVSGSELPISIKLEGETVYSIRVKGISSAGLEDSKWSITSATTLSEQLFLPIQVGDILGKQATLRWVPNSNVTQIILKPGDITHVITPQEKIDGIATVTGLSSQTIYTADLFNNTSRRGSEVITTNIDVSDGIEVKPTDNLNDVVANAASGALLILNPGDYTVFTNTEVILTKSITIRGLYSYNKPKLHVKFTVNPGVLSASLIDLDLEATALTNPSVVTISNTAGNFGDVLLKDCNIHDFTRALISGGNTSGNIVNSVTVDNCVVKNVNTNVGADFIDFRNTYVKDIIIKNSTFDNCSPSRDFVRADATGSLSGGALTTTVLIEKCTLNNVSNSAVVSPTAGKRILYLRFASNASTVKNTLITNTTAVYSNQPTTTAPTFTSNYYVNAAGFKDAAILNNRVDASGIVADPQYVNAATGDFTIKNQTLIDNSIGDPRWIK
jgi:hypothetical protein